VAPATGKAREAKQGSRKARALGQPKGLADQPLAFSLYAPQSVPSPCHRAYLKPMGQISRAKSGRAQGKTRNEPERAAKSFPMGELSLAIESAGYVNSGNARLMDEC
jgi:hypothetical protein